MKSKARKNSKPGDVYAIPLKSGGYAFGMVCHKNDFAFFDFRTDSLVLPDGLLNFSLSFRVPVAKDAPASGKWNYLGHVELTGDYARPSRYLHKPIGSEQCYIYCGGVEEPATREECAGLEILSTWFSFHIEDRLDDYFSGRESKCVIAMKKYLGV